MQIQSCRRISCAAWEAVPTRASTEDDAMTTPRVNTVRSDTAAPSLRNGDSTGHSGPLENSAQLQKPLHSSPTRTWVEGLRKRLWG